MRDGEVCVELCEDPELLWRLHTLNALRELLAIAHGIPGSVNRSESCPSIGRAYLAATTLGTEHDRRLVDACANQPGLKDHFRTCVQVDELESLVTRWFSPEDGLGGANPFMDGRRLAGLWVCTLHLGIVPTESSNIPSADDGKDDKSGALRFSDQYLALFQRFSLWMHAAIRAVERLVAARAKQLGSTGAAQTVAMVLSPATAILVETKSPKIDTLPFADIAASMDALRHSVVLSQALLEMPSVIETVFYEPVPS